jgi:2-oxoglutarate dehydrogenase E2 component (dihydrolipoamide succinyltransferase)
MNLEIKVPAVGESITEVTIAEWVKKDGEHVEMDEVIAELESDKATFELNAEKSGILHIRANEGDTLEVGAIICEIETEAEEKSEKTEEKAAPAEKNKTEDTKKEKAETGSESKPKPSGEVIEVKIPTVGESITEVTIASWAKEDGDFVELDEVIAELESDKATFELTAEAAGILKIKVQAGETLEIGAVVCNIEVTQDKPATSEGTEKQPQKDNMQEKPAKEEEKKEKATTYASGSPSPAAAKILSEKGIDPKDVNGSGKDGRITKEDAEKAEKQQPSAPEKKPEVAKDQAQNGVVKKDAPQTIAQQADQRGQRREKMTNLRKTISRRLVSVKNETAMLTTFNEVDMQPVMEMRKKYKEAFKEKYEVNLGFMSFFTKACCMALQEWPSVNAMIDGEEIVYNEYCDVSIAVSTPRGLVVPVIRNAEKMGFDQIEKEIIHLATKARDNKLSIEDMTGGTFTITNGGVFGSMLSTPIINAPQSAILGMHNIVERPVAVNGEVVIRPIMYVALSYDHRIVDGRESVSFLYRVKELLEDPARLLLGV